MRLDINLKGALVGLLSLLALGCSQAPKVAPDNNQITMDRPVIQSLDNVDASLKNLEKSLVRLTVSFEGKTSYGTGFFYGSRDLLITSHHLFHEKHECLVEKKCQILIGQVVNSKEVKDTPQMVEVILQDPAKDIIFLKILNPETLSQIIPIKEKATDDQGDLTAVGFFQDQPALTFSKGKKISSRLNEASPHTVLTNIIVSAGFSGSPIVNKKGQLVGIVSSFRPIQGQAIGLAQYNLTQNQNNPF